MSDFLDARVSLGLVEVLIFWDLLLDYIWVLLSCVEDIKSKILKFNKNPRISFMRGE